MNSSRSSNRWVIGLAVLAAAVIAPMAQATRHDNSVPGFSHVQDLNAMEARYRAEATLLKPAATGYPSHLQDLNALEAQAQLNLKAVSAEHTDGHDATGFDRRDLRIGTFGLALLLAGTGLAVQSRRRRDGPAARSS